ncbi:MAG: hypothetical protein AB8I08_28695 [Sandaracinaceae bacterium]
MRDLRSTLGLLVLLALPCSAAAQTEPSVVATFEATGAQIDFRLLVRDGHVYLVHAYGGQQVAVGGRPMPWFRVDGYSPPHAALLSSGRVIWGAGNDTVRRRRGETRILSANLDGTGVRELARADGRPCGIVADGADIFFVDTDHGTLRRLRAGRVQTLARPPTGRVFAPDCNTPMGIDADALYLPSRAPTGAPEWEVHRVARQGRSRTELARGFPAEVVQRNGPDVFFYGRLGGPVMRVSPTGGPATEFLPAERRGSPLVSFGAHFYYARIGLTDDVPYSIARVSRTGGVPEVLYTGDARRVFHLAVDATGVYWLTSGHPPGDCHVEFSGCGQMPMRDTVCDSPDVSLLRVAVP